MSCVCAEGLFALCTRSYHHGNLELGGRRTHADGRADTPLAWVRRLAAPALGHFGGAS